MNRYKIKFWENVFIAVGLLLFSNGQAQDSNGILSPVKKSEIGITGGVSYYVGDFNKNFLPYVIRPNESFFYKYNVRPMVGLFYRYNFSKFFCGRLQISAGTVQGDSHKYNGTLPGFPVGVDLAFKRNYYALEGMGEFHFFPYSSVDPKRRKIISPYLVLGLGYIRFDKNKIKNEYLGSAMKQHPALYDSIRTCGSVDIPLGLGIKYSPMPKWTIGAEFIFRKTNTDKIDKFINRKSKNSFNIYDKDWVVTVGITISYRFVSSKPCSAYVTNKSNKNRTYKGRK